MRRLTSLAALVLLCALAAWADITLPAVLAGHMVVQRGMPVHVWGKAAPGEAVSAEFRGATRTAKANDDGLWSLYFPAGEAGGPFELKLQGANTIVLEDVLVGDVWVASGQSNMELPLKSSADPEVEVPAAKFPRIRLFHANNKVADYPLDDIDAKTWTDCTPETAASFSAVAYYFGRHLQEKLSVPIGLIEAAWGGTPADSWISLHGISRDPALMPVFAEWSRITGAYNVWRPRRQKRLREWNEAVARAKAEGKEAPPYPWEGNSDGEWQPAGLFNSMIAPLTPFPIRGAIWYQGESNAGSERAPLYARLFQAMIRDWRRAWGQGDFPFFFVQLAAFKTGAMWPEVREAQHQTLSLTNTGMAVAIDIGDPVDIHPKNKKEVGRRLALAALAISHGERIEYSGPMFRQATAEGGSIRVSFDHAAGLAAKNGPPAGFEVAGADRKFVSADAVVEGATILVSNPAVPAPVYVRYGWSDYPPCNLYNSDGLPASPFRSGE